MEEFGIGKISAARCAVFQKLPGDEMDRARAAAEGQLAGTAPQVAVNDLPTVDMRLGGESRVLVLYTGGTIGMASGPHGTLEPAPNKMADFIREIPYMHDREYAKKRFGDGPNTPFVMPKSPGKQRVVYTLFEYQPLLDSSQMTPRHWSRLAQDIERVYEWYEGFVVLHGTDTLSYTASALSFMLENLAKTVIVTGAQIPIFESRSDGREHLVNSLVLAGNYCIPEVTVFFNDKLFRGNRIVKTSSTKFAAFDSPNLPPLATIGINVEVDFKAIMSPPVNKKFKVHSNLNCHVSILRFFPTITASTVRAFLEPPAEGVVLQSYGAGNMPSDRADLMAVVCDATARGVVVVNCTQCAHGSVAAIYQTGAVLAKMGVISGGDMTTEAAFTKLCYVLSKNWDVNTKRKMMLTDLRGEMTPQTPQQQRPSAAIQEVMRRLPCNREVLVTAATGMPGRCDAQEKLRISDHYQGSMLRVASSQGPPEMLRFLVETEATLDRPRRTVT